MPIHPALITGPPTNPQGLSETIADLKRRISNIGGGPTIIGPGSITGGQIAPGAIDVSGVTIADGSITADKIAAHTITAAQIAAGTITTELLAAGAVVANTIAAGTITANEIATNTIIASNIAANTITASKIAAETITAQNIAAGAITTDKITAGAVTASKINVADLSAVSTNMGSISAGTITGATVQTATTGSRVRLDSSGLVGYALNGTTKTFEINTGTGIASFTGLAFLDPNSTIPARSITGAIGGGNLLINSSFESTDPADPGQHFGLNGVTIASSATQAIYGTKSLRVAYASGTAPFARYTISSTLHSDVWNAIKGRPVVLSAWVFVENVATSRGANTNRVLQTVDSTGVNNTLTIDDLPKGAWTRINIKTTVPAVATSFEFQLWNPYTNGFVYFDGVQLEIGDAMTSYAPRPDEILYASIRSQYIGAGEIQTNNLAAGAVKAGNISVEWSGPNRVNNSSFEGSIDYLEGWDTFGSVGATRSAALSHSGAAVQLKNVTTPLSTINLWLHNLPNRVLVSQNTKYVASAWVYSTTARSWTIAIDAQNAAGTSLNNASNSVAVPVNTWTRIVSPVITTATGATHARIDIIALGVTTSTEAHYVDDVQMEEGEVVTPYGPKPDEILTGSVGNTKITPNSVTADKFIAGTITAREIAGSTITAAQIQANTITAGQMAAGTITANEIQAGAVTATKISATAIDGKTITGATLRTAATYPSMIIDVNGLNLPANTGGPGAPFTVSQISWRDALGGNPGTIEAYIEPSGDRVMGITVEGQNAQFYIQRLESAWPANYFIVDRDGMTFGVGTNQFSMSAGGADMHGAIRFFDSIHIGAFDVGHAYVEEQWGWKFLTNSSNHPMRIGPAIDMALLVGYEEYGSSYGQGQVHSNGGFYSPVAYNGSDINMKDDVEAISERVGESALDLINRITPIRYRHKDSVFQDTITKNRRRSRRLSASNALTEGKKDRAIEAEIAAEDPVDDGFVFGLSAQEVELRVPSAVGVTIAPGEEYDPTNPEKGAIKAIDYSQITVLLLRAVQQLTEKVTELEKDRKPT